MILFRHFADGQRDIRWIVARTIDLLGRFVKILFGRLIDAGHPSLRVAINKREPGALDLYHHSMTFKKRMVSVVQADYVRENFAGRNRLRTRKALTVSSAEYFAADHHLVAAQIPAL